MFQVSRHLKVPRPWGLDTYSAVCVLYPLWVAVASLVVIVIG